MRSIAEIDGDIARVQAELQDVHGTTTEVYARIVGYYRSVRNWNRGKREEYNHRKLFVSDEARIIEHLPADSCDCTVRPVEIDSAEIEAVTPGGKVRYELFVRKTCPNCPPVKECCSHLPVSGELVDVDSPEGFARASALGVFSAPTVIFFDETGAEAGRAHSVKEVRSLPVLAGQAEPMLAMF